MALSTTIKTIQDIMRKDAGVDGDAQRISQLVWMIFLKVFDDHEEQKELLEDDYESPIPKRFRWRTWAKNPEGITGEDLVDFINNELFRKLKELPTTGPNAALAGVVRSVFEDAFNYMKSGTLLRQVVNKLNEIDFNRASDRHEFGDVYEKLLSDLQNAGNAGEFYTPRAVTQFIVDQVDPQLGEKILDPACGTGGFLSCAIEHVRKKHVKSTKDEAKLQASIFGVEKKPLPHLLCVTNMMFHGIEVPSNIKHDNTLARPLRDYGPKDRVDVILTNPPFGGMEEDGIENNFPATFRTRETADLFLVLIMTLLRPGGRAALVLPDGTLFGEGIKTRIKEKLLEDCNLHTIVRLPKGVFAPYTGIKTNLLFFTKGEPTKNVWFYEHPYPAGAKSYSKTKPLRIEEFAPEKKWWGKRKETDRAWKVSIEDIKARGYNLDIKNPRAVDDGPGDPDELLKEYQEAAAEAAKLRAQLRDELRKALEGARSWKRVVESFDVLIDRAEKVSGLRSSILRLAVSGRLVGGQADPDGASRRRSVRLARRSRSSSCTRSCPWAGPSPGESVLIHRRAAPRSRAGRNCYMRPLVALVASLVSACASYAPVSTCWQFDSDYHPESCSRLISGVSGPEAQRAVCGSSTLSQDPCRIDGRVARCVFTSASTGAAFTRDFYGAPVGGETVETARSACDATVLALGGDWSFELETN
ncbi:MAG: class I SAM-dependent DNA methyltransferase [Sandaracinus sp.]